MNQVVLLRQQKLVGVIVVTEQRSMDLTELEGNALGIIGVKKRCTPYAVRREFQQSPSPYWSGSAGAIYPLFSRLEKRGFIRMADRTVDGRSGKLFCLTTAGKQALRIWIGDLGSPIVTGIPPDPLRNRIEFFSLISKKEQKTFLSDALLKVQYHLVEINEYAEIKKVEGNLYDYLIAVGSAKVMQARLKWLCEAVEALGFASIHGS